MFDGQGFVDKKFYFFERFGELAIGRIQRSCKHLKELQEYEHDTDLLE